MWFIYATVAMLCFVGMQIVLKQLTRMNLAPPLILVFLFGFTTVLFLSHVGVTRQSMMITTRAAGLLAAAAACSYAGNLYMVRSVAIAPNPGYAIAVVGLQALPLTVIALFMFGAPLSWVKMLGVVLSISGVVLLMLDR